MSARPVLHSSRFSRRAVLKCSGIVAGALLLPWARVLPQRIQGATVSLHMDKPYFGAIGGGLDYLPRGFMDGAGPLRLLSEHEWRMRYPYL